MNLINYIKLITYTTLLTAAFNGLASNGVTCNDLFQNSTWTGTAQVGDSNTPVKLHVSNNYDLQVSGTTNAYFYKGTFTLTQSTAQKLNLAIPTTSGVITPVVLTVTNFICTYDTSKNMITSAGFQADNASGNDGIFVTPTNIPANAQQITFPFLTFPTKSQTYSMTLTKQ